MSISLNQFIQFQVSIAFFLYSLAWFINSSSSHFSRNSLRTKLVAFAIYRSMKDFMRNHSILAHCCKIRNVSRPYCRHLHIGIRWFFLSPTLVWGANANSFKYLELVGEGCITHLKFSLPTILCHLLQQSPVLFRRRIDSRQPYQLHRR